MVVLPRLVQKIPLFPRIGLLSNYQVFCTKCSDQMEKAVDNRSKFHPAGEGYETVYKFPQIRFIAAFSRLKIYHAVGTALSVSVSFILASQGFVDPQLPLATAYLGISMGVFLFGTGVATNRYVGFIYFNESKDALKVAYVDYWGNRKEKELPVSDIIPLSEAPMNYIGYYIYKPLQLYSGGKSLKIISNYGVIVNKEKFNRIFLL